MQRQSTLTWVAVASVMIIREDIGSLANVDFELNRVDLEVLIKE